MAWHTYNRAMPAITDKLLADETVVAETTKHWIAPVRDSWKPALLLIAALILRVLSPDDATGAITGGLETIIGWVVIGLVIVAIGWIVYNVVVWRTAAFAVTSMRVIREEGLLSKRSSATMLNSVTDVGMKVPFIGSRLGYGDLAIITSSGEMGADRFQSITAPDAFRTKILEAKMAREGGAPASVQAAAAPPAPAAPPTAAEAAPATPPPTPDDVDTLTRLAELRDSGAITAEEYEAKKAEILSRL
jgi:uncharacterized membrane protein YdbT with pleckstrin-like domain